MQQLNFEPYKLRRAILKDGEAVVFYRQGVNMFGEPEMTHPLPKMPGYAPKGAPDPDPRHCAIGMLTGVFHSQNNWGAWQNNGQIAERVIKTDALLCLYEDLKQLGLRQGDYCFINKNKYTISSFENYQEANIITDIMFETQDDAKELKYAEQH